MMADQWAPFAVRRDGPAWKVGYSFIGEAGPKRGQVNHSAEGYWAGLYSALDGPLQKSWQLTVGYDRVEQHYPISAHCWHAGDVDDDGAVAANLDFIGVEFLGMAGLDLAPFQIDMAVEISRWSAEQESRSLFRRFDGWDPDEPGLWLLAEHNEVSDVSTACPSGRIPWAEIMTTLKEEDMADQETRKTWAQAAAIFGRAAWYASQGIPFKELPDDLKAQLRYLMPR